MHKLGGTLDTVVEHDDDGWIWIIHQNVQTPYKFGIPPGLRITIRDEINESLIAFPEEENDA